MPLQVGSRVGPYEVMSLLGSGGMGEVWRARHAALRRDDALKVLPDGVAADPARLARFEREAQVLASLNHPNVAHVYGLEESGGSRVLVMELVDGPTLAEVIAQGPVPVERALEIARQIAQGLEAAHERSIVHRDLKPANVKVRPDGVVKVLDFGLAKAFQSESSDSGAAAEGATLTYSQGSLTREGVVVGTPAYMSPEQLRGDPVDARSDTWAFGCVLYEMLTGRRPFSGPSTPDVVARVLTGTPDWSLLPRDVPPFVRVLLRRCLSRDLRQRPKHLSSVLLVVDDESLSTGAGSPAAGRPVGAPWLWPAIAASAAALVTGGVFFAWWMTRPAAAVRVVRSAILADTIMALTDRNFSVTPDGTRIVYIGGDAATILVRRLDAAEPEVILKTPAYVRGVMVAPDGESIAYVENAFSLKKMSILGGAVAPIAQLDGPSRGLAWGSDNTIVFGTAAKETGLQQVSVAGGPVTVLTRPQATDNEADHVEPVWLPDGRHVLFTIQPLHGGLDESRVAVLDVGTRTWRTLIDGGFGAHYIPGGFLVYGASGALWGVRFDQSRMQTQGTPFKVLAPLTVMRNGFALFDTAADGTLVYARDVPTEADGRSLVWVDRDGRETPLAVPPASQQHPRLSPDGKRLAVSSNGVIVVWDMARPWSSATRLPSPPTVNWFPVWTPDGRRVVFGSWRGGGFSNLYIQEPGTAEADRLTQSGDMQLPTSITRDGTTVIFTSFTKRIEAVRLDAGSARPQVLVDTPREERNGEVSPDGRWIAYEGESASQPGRLDVYVRPFPDTASGLWQVTTDGGLFPVWRRDGRELFYYKPDGTLVALPVEASDPTWSTGQPKDLFKGPYLYQGDGSMGRQYDVTADGQRFIMLKTTHPPGGPSHFVLVQNFVSELKSR